MAFIFLPGDGSVTPTIISSQPFSWELKGNGVGGPQAASGIDGQRANGFARVKEATGIEGHGKQGFGLCPSGFGSQTVRTGSAAASLCAVSGSRRSLVFGCQLLLFFFTMRLLTRSLKRMVTILRNVWRGSWGRGAPPSDSGIEPAVIQNVGMGAFPGRHAIGQGALRIGRFGLRRKILRVKFPAQKMTFGTPRYDVSPIHSATPPH